MLQMQANDIRSRLRLTASVLVVAAGLGVSAQAQTTLTSSNTPWVMDGDTTVTNIVIASGSTGFFTASYNAIPVGDLGIVWNSGPQLSSTGSCAFGGCFATSDIINVASGGKLIIDNPWGWQPFQSIFNATGDVEIMPANWGGGQTILMGSNTFLGNFTVDAGFWGNVNTIQVGQNWAPAAIVFGPNTNVILQDSTLLELWMGGASTTIGGTVSGTGSIALHSGTIGFNGINTAAKSFTGTVTIDGGATIVVGDVTHPNAVFGDPTASAAVINVGQGGGAMGTLKGYGSIYGNVNSAGSVSPGGTSGTLGTLAIHGNYTQSSVGQLVTVVTPTGTSKLTVTGTANVSGSLTVKVSNGTYTTPALYSVLTSSALTGSFSTISVQGDAAFVGAVRSSTGYQVAVESSTSPQTFAHQAQVNRFNVTEFSRAINDRLDIKTDPNGKVVGWLSPYGSVESIGHNGLGFSNTTYGVRGGVEYHSLWKNAVIGLAGSYGAGSMDVKGEGSTADSNTYTAAVYGGVDFLYARIDGSLSLSKYDTSIKRSLGTLGTVTSAPEGSTWGASVKISQDIFGGLVTPFAAGYMQRVHLNGATEVGNSFALRYNAIDKNFMVADLGAKVHVIRQPTLKLDFTLAVEHDFSDRGESSVAQFANIAGSSAAYYWKGDSENTLITGLYLADSITNKLDIFARVNGQFSTYKRAADFSIGAKLKI